MKTPIFAFTILFFSFGLFAQELDELAIQSPGNFYEIQKTKNDYFEANPNAKGFKQWKRNEWFMEPRLYPSGEMKNLSFENLKAQERYFREKPVSRSTHGSWLFAGPNDWTQEANNNGLGRVNSIDFHPTNDQIIYACTAAGGVWRTTNGGGNWANISPHIPLLFVTDVEIDPTNTNVLYLLTGDGDIINTGPPSHTQNSSPSIGILKSTDGGATWSPTEFSFTSESTLWPLKLIMHPNDPNTQFVASLDGIYKTENAWIDFSLVHATKTFDIEFKPGSPSIMYASEDKRILKSTTFGNTWNPVSDPDLAIYANSSRIELAVSPDNPDGIYAIGGGAGYDGVMESTSSGADNTWVIRDTIQPHFWGQSTYNMAISVDPGNYDKVFAGMVGMNRSFSNGVAGTWTHLNGLHPDYHDIVHRNGNIYAAHDGGIVKSTDDGNTWNYISEGIQCTQIYRISGTPQNPNLNVIGTQDCGFMMRSGFSTTFSNLGNGDGMISIIDYTDPDILYIVGQLGGALKFHGYDIIPGVNPLSMFVPGGAGAWVTPLTIDPVDPEVLFLARDAIYRTDNGAADSSWITLGDPSGGVYNCLAQGANNRNRLYTSNTSNIWRTDNALSPAGPATWTPIKAGLPDLFITDIEVNPLDANEVFVTVSGLEEGQKVYKSTNGGLNGSWTNISGSLPNTPVNCILHDQNSGIDDALYIGTDLGVFYYNAVLGDWIFYGNFMPAVPITDLFINSQDFLMAGTWGRGLWMSPKYSGCIPTLNLLNAVTFGGHLEYTVSDNITSAADYRFDVGTDVSYQAGEFIDLKPGFKIGGLAGFQASIGPCPAITNMQPFSISNTFGNLILTTDQVKMITN